MRGPGPTTLTLPRACARFEEMRHLEGRTKEEAEEERSRATPDQRPTPHSTELPSRGGRTLECWSALDKAFNKSVLVTSQDVSMPVQAYPYKTQLVPFIP